MAKRYRIVICRGPECGDRRNSAALHDVFRNALAAQAARDRVELAWQSCFGRCTQGPNVLVRELDARPALGTGFAAVPTVGGTAVLYNHIDAARVERVVSDHIVGGRTVREFVERPGILHSEPVGSRQKDG